MKIKYAGNIIYTKKVNSLLELEEEMLESAHAAILSKNYDPISYGVALVVFLVQETISYFKAKAAAERIDELEGLLKDLTNEQNCKGAAKIDSVDAFLSLKSKGIIKVEFDEKNENEVKLAFDDLEKRANLKLKHK